MEAHRDVFPSLMFDVTDLEERPAVVRASFDIFGVIGVRGLLTPQGVEALQGIFEAFRASGLFDEREQFEQLVFGTRMDTRLRDLALGTRIPLAARVALGRPDIRLLYDHIFIKRPASPVPSAWHHDGPYLPTSGGALCSVWVPTDPVETSTGGLEFVAGSHQWPYEFRAETPYISQGSDTGGLVALPDIEELRSTGAIVSAALDPGDAWVFDTRTIHGGSANTSPTMPRSALATRWFTPDVVYAPRPYSIDLPGHESLTIGGPLDTDDFPVPFPVSDR